MIAIDRRTFICAVCGLAVPSTRQLDPYVRILSHGVVSEAHRCSEWAKGIGVKGVGHVRLFMVSKPECSRWTVVEFWVSIDYYRFERRGVPVHLRNDWLDALNRSGRKGAVRLKV